MITGAQLREALRQLGLQPSQLAGKAKLPTTTIARAVAAEGEAVITIAQEQALRQALVSLGIVFLNDNADLGVRSRDVPGGAGDDAPPWSARLREWDAHLRPPRS